MAKNHCLAKSINDASWYQFRIWFEYFGKVFGKVTVAVNPQYTSQECSSCGAIVKKTLSTRTQVCQCGCLMDRDFNAARNILSRGLATVGHTLLEKSCISKSCRRSKNPRAFTPGSVKQLSLRDVKEIQPLRYLHYYSAM